MVSLGHFHLDFPGVSEFTTSLTWINLNLSWDSRFTQIQLKVLANDFQQSYFLIFILVPSTWNVWRVNFMGVSSALCIEQIFLFRGCFIQIFNEVVII